MTVRTEELEVLLLAPQDLADGVPGGRVLGAGPPHRDDVVDLQHPQLGLAAHHAAPAELRYGHRPAPQVVAAVADAVRVVPALG